ncbi:alpha/beta fold hydrolase [Chloroflexota bacterium]
MKDTTKRIEDAKIQLSDGVMHYQSLGRGSPVVLLHSMASSVWSWSKVMEPLAQKHVVFALDTMGQGDSDKPSRDYTIEDYAGSVVNFMDAKGMSKATLIGNSVGAVIAVRIAVANAAMVDKLILVGCPCRETEQERKEAIVTSKAQYDDMGIPLPRSQEDLKQHFVHVSPELQSKVNEDRAKAGVWAWKCTVVNNSFDIIPALKKVAAKTLVIFGEKDRLRTKEKVLKNHIKGSKLVIIPDAGHLPQVDNPEAFLASVKQFLG